MDAKYLLSDYYREFLESISYELTDADKVCIVNQCCSRIQATLYFKEIVKTAVNSELADKLNELIRYEEHLLELFESNNGDYVYIITEQEDIIGVFSSLNIAVEYGYSNFSKGCIFSVRKHAIKKDTDETGLNDQSVCICKQGYSPYVIVIDCSTYEREKDMYDNYITSLDNCKSYMPIPFKSGDIIWCDIPYEGRIMGVVNAQTCSPPHRDYGFVNTKGVYYFKNNKQKHSYFNPFTAEPVIICEDFKEWRKLNELSKILKHSNI